MLVVGKYLYLDDSGAGHLTIVDISNPARPVQKGVYTTQGCICDIAVAGEYAYLAMAYTVASMEVVHIADPDRPAKVASFTIPDTVNTAHSIALNGNYAYLGGTFKGLIVLDIANPTNPRGLRALPEGGGGDSVVADGYLYTGGLQIFDLTDPQAPMKVGSLDGEGQHIAVADGYIFVSGSSSLRLMRYTGLRLEGRVVQANGRPLGGAVIQRGGGQQAGVDATGSYTITALARGTYTLTPTLSGHVFLPPTRTISLPPNGVAVNFTALRAPIGALLTPHSTTEVVYTDTQGVSTQLMIPANTVSETATLTFSGDLAEDGPGFTFAGHGFVLNLVQNGSPLQTFGAPISVLVDYSNEDIHLVVDENRLLLAQWTGTGWEDVTQGCVGATYIRDVSANVLTTKLCRPGRFALFGPTNQTRLPVTTLVSAISHKVDPNSENSLLAVLQPNQ